MHSLFAKTSKTISQPTKTPKHHPYPLIANKHQRIQRKLKKHETKDERVETESMPGKSLQKKRAAKPQLPKYTGREVARGAPLTKTLGKQCSVIAR